MNIQSLHAQRVAVSPGEFAAVTGLSISTVHRRLAAGDIKFSRSGRRVLIPLEELERLVRPAECTA
jgi:excisionase family DNA binding protein